MRSDIKPGSRPFLTFVPQNRRIAAHRHSNLGFLLYNLAKPPVVGSASNDFFGRWLRYQHVQEPLGHKDISTTMIYIQVLNRGGKGVHNPAESAWTKCSWRQRLKIVQCLCGAKTVC
jgi:hypothetical protein